MSLSESIHVTDLIDLTESNPEEISEALKDIVLRLLDVMCEQTYDTEERKTEAIYKALCESLDQLNVVEYSDLIEKSKISVIVSEHYW